MLPHESSIRGYWASPSAALTDGCDRHMQTSKSSSAVCQNEEREQLVCGLTGPWWTASFTITHAWTQTLVNVFINSQAVCHSSTHSGIDHSACGNYELVHVNLECCLISGAWTNRRHLQCLTITDEQLVCGLTGPWWTDSLFIMVLNFNLRIVTIQELQVFEKLDLEAVWFVRPLYY